MARRSGANSKVGFTVPEVLVALAIFALASIVLGSTYLNIITAYARAANGGAEDPYLAQARQELMTQTDLTAAEAGDEFDTPQEPAVPGQTAAPSEHVKWTADIEPTQVADLFTVTFTCVLTPTGAGAAKTDVETFMLLRPTWSQPTDRPTLKQNAATAIAVLQGRQQQ
ncbi:MAG: PulJ/GspJ family protein [Opitutaceae bacterium]